MHLLQLVFLCVCAVKEENQACVGSGKVERKYTFFTLAVGKLKNFSFQKGWSRWVEDGT